MTLVDTNVLLDLFTNHLEWADWSIRQLEAASLKGPLAIDDVVYAELSVRFDAIETLDAALMETGVSIEPMPRAALFLAGKAFQRYRARGGAKSGVPPDFFIGAHAAVTGWPLLTRDARRYRTAFSRVELVAP
jgi:hypothetical protein